MLCPLRSPGIWSALAGALVAVCAAAGCFSPSYRSTPFSCDESDLCPEGYRCVEGVCTNRPGPEAGSNPYPDTGEEPGGDSGADSAPDTGAVDQPRPVEGVGPEAQLIWSCSTDTQWNDTGAAKAGVAVDGTGEAAVLIINSPALNASARPTVAASGGGTAKAWITPEKIKAADGSGARADLAACCSGSVSERLLGTGFGFKVPDGAMVTGVAAEVIREQSGTADMARDNELYLLSQGKAIGSNKARTTQWTNAYTPATYGGAADLWGLGSLPLSVVNATDFGLAVSAKNVHSGYAPSVYVDSTKLTVYYKNASGSFVSPTIKHDATAKGWYRLEAVQSVPSQCGTGAVTYEVLSEPGAAVLRSGGAPLDLSGIDHVDVRIKIKLSTANPSFSPRVDAVILYALKAN